MIKTFLEDVKNVILWVKMSCVEMKFMDTDAFDKKMKNHKRVMSYTISSRQITNVCVPDLTFPHSPELENARSNSKVTQ